MAACHPREPADELPLPYDYTPPADEGSIEIGLADVEAAVAETLGQLASIDIGPGFEAYEEAMSLADPQCPYETGYEDYTYWYDDCRAESGTRFDGYVIGYDYVDYVIDGGVYNGNLIYGYAAIEAEDGLALTFSGQLFRYDYVYEDAGYHAWYAGLYGSLQGTFPSATGTWVEAGTLGEPWMTVGVTGGDGHFFQGGGTVGLRSEDFPIAHVSLLNWNDAGTGEPCPGEPELEMSLRTPQGDWVDIDFDGGHGENGATMIERCDGCGEVSFHGEAIGSVCVDPELMPQVEVSPW
jgi:hypothetical protein